MVLARNNRASKPASRVTRLTQTLYRAERGLVDPETRHSGSELERLLHPEYTETGSTGNVYDRETIIEMMLGEQPGGVVIRDFQAQLLNEECALVTYRSIGLGGQEARRSSIWVLTEDEWRLRYHQGTRIPNSWGTIS